MFFQAAGCRVVSGDPRQWQHTLNEGELKTNTVEARWLGQKTYKICDTEVQVYFWPCCEHCEHDLTRIGRMKKGVPSICR